MERDLLAQGPDPGGRNSVAPGGWTLPSAHGSAGFALELPSPARLVVAGHTSGGGELTLHVDERSPAEGRSLAAREVRVGARGGRLDTELDLASTAGGVLFVDLAWKSAEGADLLLERLELQEQPRERVPVILFSVDTLAAHHMSLHGYERATTPNLERLAAESVVFDRCLSNAPFTPPSYASQFTGLLPRSTWLDPVDFERRERRQPKKYETWNVPAERWTLAESLRAAGYRTAAFVDNPMASPAFGLAQGFEFYDMSAQAIPIGDPDGGIRTIVPAALRWMDGLPEGEPFFLFVNVLDVHGPYGPPPEFRGRFGSNDPSLVGPELPVCPSGHEVFGAIPDYNAYTLVKKPPLPEHLPSEPLVRLYDEEILFVDSALAEFVDALRERGLLERCALVVSADHGEVMGEGDFKFGHGVCVQENLHVPLLVRLPQGRFGGTRIERPVQLLDLYPTLLELAGVAPRPYLHGRSLLPLMRGESIPETPIWHEGGLLESTAVTEGKWRLVEWDLGSDNLKTRYSFPLGKRLLEERSPKLYHDLWGQGTYAAFVAALDRDRRELRRLDAGFAGMHVRELFDITTDPHQLVNVAAQHPDEVERLGRLLDEGHERSRSARTQMAARATELDGSLETELRALGYVGDGDAEE